MELKELSLRGQEIERYIDDLGSLRIQVFAEWPYLYKGDLNYERNYLKTYTHSERSFIFMLTDQGRVVGATTAIHLEDETPEFKAPFVNNGYDLNTILYFGESLLLPQYRGFGYGKKFMEKRLEFANAFPNIKTVAFCAVQRNNEDPRRPNNHRSLDTFWKQTGFIPNEKLIAHYTWQDIGDTNPTTKPLKFWLKNIR